MVLPKEIRDSYGLKPGDNLTLLDLGEVLVLTRERSAVDELASRLSQTMSERGETLESMLEALREERDRFAGAD